MLPSSLQQRAVDWYYTVLCHPGETRTEATIRKHFTFKGLRAMVHHTCKTCDTCQRTKKNKKNYGLLPPKEAEASPWDVLCVDLIGPYIFRKGSGKRIKEIKLHCITKIDPAMGWLEMREIPNKRADEIANIVEQTWFTRYPWPTKIIFDRGSEFMVAFAMMCAAKYGLINKNHHCQNPSS